jgi:hypothetical protein
VDKEPQDTETAETLLAIGSKNRGDIPARRSGKKVQVMGLEPMTFCV